MIYLYLFGTCFHFIYVFMIIGKESYIRENSKTIKIEGPKLLAASKLFE